MNKMRHHDFWTSAIFPVGLGFRFQFADTLLKRLKTPVEFIEIAPENYFEAGGRRGRRLDMALARFPTVCHGLSGDFLGLNPLDTDYWERVSRLLHDVGTPWFSDHLCVTQAHGQVLHELFPPSMNLETVKRTAARIREIQHIIQLPIAIENVSAYIRTPESTMSETEFISAVVQEADCQLLLDINNIVVNAHNFDFEAITFIDNIPLERVLQLHVAGHEDDESGLKIDTHGKPIPPPVLELLRYTLPKISPRTPILLERDKDIPTLSALEEEVRMLQQLREEVLADV